MPYVGGKLEPWFDDAPVGRTIRNMVRLGVRRGKELTVEKTPVETGDLKESWKETRPTKAVGSHYPGTGYGASWYSEVEYAPYVEHGTGLWGPEHKKYLILPKKPGGSLHWVGPGGVDVYSKGVMHPGSPGAHMVSDAAAQLEAQIETVVAPALHNWVFETEHQNPYAL